MTPPDRHLQARRRKLRNAGVSFVDDYELTDDALREIEHCFAWYYFDRLQREQPRPDSKAIRRALDKVAVRADRLLEALHELDDRAREIVGTFVDVEAATETLQQLRHGAKRVAGGAIETHGGPVDHLSMIPAGTAGSPASPERLLAIDIAAALASYSVSSADGERARCVLELMCAAGLDVDLPQIRTWLRHAQ